MVLEYKCPSCGGAVSFNSVSQKMKCPYCESEFQVSTIKKYQEALEGKDSIDEIETKREVWRDDRLSSYVCSSCGGEIIANAKLVSSFCPFCSNNVIFQDKLTGQFKPDLIIPFSLNKESAFDCYLSSIKGMKLLPDSFFKKELLDTIKGIYVPYWAFSATCTGFKVFRGINVKEYKDSDSVHTVKNVYYLHRSGTMSFSNIALDASSDFTDQIMDEIGPYDFKKAVKYDSAYLAGFYADKYDVSQSSLKSKVVARVKESFDRFLRSSIDAEYGKVESANSSNVKIEKTTAKYALLPVYVLNIKWNNKSYRFYINGQTGKAKGEYPVSKRKKAFYSVLYFSIAVLTSFLFLSLIYFSIWWS